VRVGDRDRPMWDPFLETYINILKYLNYTQLINDSVPIKLIQISFMRIFV